jgi:PadR family transcriptional regulator
MRCSFSMSALAITHLCRQSDGITRGRSTRYSFSLGDVFAERPQQKRKVRGKSGYSVLPSAPFAFPMKPCNTPLGNQMEGAERDLVKQKRDVQQGTLALMVLKTLQVLGPLHGYGIARRIAQISNELLSVNQGTLYPVLLRLEQERAVASEWGPSENNRRARFYRLTRAGEKLLEAEKRDWEQTAAIIARFFEVKTQDLR